MGFNFPQVYIDPESVRTQKESALLMIESQANIARERSRAEYDAQKSGIHLQAEHESCLAEAAIEQSKHHALFALDQQHQQRRLEIEQKSQEQRLQIEATSSQLMMQAQQQRLQREMNERFTKLQSQRPQTAGGTINLFSTSNNLGGHSFHQSTHLFNVPNMFPPSPHISNSGTPKAKHN